MFKKKVQMVITATNSITSVGHDSYMTAGSINADVAMLKESDEYYDGDKPIMVSKIEGISEKEVEDEIMFEVTEKCFNNLVDEYFQNKISNDIHILLGVPHENHPDKKIEMQWEKHKQKLMEKALEKTDHASFSAFYCGNPSVFFALKKAAEELSKKSGITFIIGSSDSLLNDNIIEELIDNRRIKSANFGRNHGLTPSQGAGFMIVESKDYAISKEKEMLAEIKGVGISEEPSPLNSGKPTRYSGLTEAINKTIKENKLETKDIKTVFSDMNGEYFRAKEWSFASLRCFKKSEHDLIHPADCFGAIGAASGSVLTNIASVYLSEEWIEKDAMIVCSDDYGCCGSLVLGKFEE
ncbi:MAG: hypothetical protein GY714_25920 [Desulfobacterales bacterium]|nr:hypothetical protein [Desulfobacterales bacterium]